MSSSSRREPHSTRSAKCALTPVFGSAPQLHGVTSSDAAYRRKRLLGAPELASAAVSLTHVLGSAAVETVPPRRSPSPATKGPKVMIGDHGRVSAVDQLTRSGPATRVPLGIFAVRGSQLSA